MNFNEPVYDICKKCGQRKGEHQARTMCCPNTIFMKHKTMGWTAYVKDQKFELKEPPVCAKCGKMKIYHEKETLHCPLGSYIFPKGYVTYHPYNKYEHKKKWTKRG